MAALYEEEHFGILTDDDLYLDCLLVRPAGATDSNLTGIRVWVPKFPLTKTSTILCARREIEAQGARLHTAHLTFDLRGSGNSDGAAEDERYEIDLRSIKAWAAERFGPGVTVSFLGTPASQFGRINLLPLNSGVVMETYYYPPHDALAGPPVLYLSSFGNFDHFDDIRCASLARSGYEVYGIDPLRYLLPASATGPLATEALAADFEALAEIVGESAFLIGQPLGAGLALLWAALSPRAAGVIGIGAGQATFKAGHIFAASAPEAFDLAIQIPRIAPRPAVLVWHEGHPLGSSPQELGDLFRRLGEPRRIEKTKEISPQFLLDLLVWIGKKSAG